MYKQAINKKLRIYDLIPENKNVDYHLNEEGHTYLSNKIIYIYSEFLYFMNFNIYFFFLPLLFLFV